MTFRWLLFFLGPLTLWSATPVLAEGLSLVALELPGLTNIKKEGAYGNLYNALQAEKIITGWEVAPILRAHQVFLTKQAACIAPSSEFTLAEYNVDPENIAPMIPFNKVQGYLFTAPKYRLKAGQKPTLGIVGLGLIFGVEQSAYELVRIATYDQLLYLVGENRVSAAYVNYPDVNHYPEAMKVAESFKGEIELRWDGVDNILCWKKHAALRNKIADAVIAWREDGSLAKMVGKYYITSDK